MDSFFRLKMTNHWRKYARFILASAWVLGLIFGTLFSIRAGNALHPAVNAAVRCSAASSGLIVALFLPLLISAVAVILSLFWMLPLIAFLKAFFFSYLAFGVLTAFGSAGFLIRSLLLFSDCCMLPLLYWYWHQHIDTGHSVHITSTAACIVAAVCIGGFDFYVVSPFLAGLIS